jgi:hypothetical protein
MGLLATALALLAPVVPAQEPRAPIPPTPFDEVFELELTADSPTATVEYFVDFEGTLHVWTRSDLDLSLRVEDTELCACR